MDKPPQHVGFAVAGVGDAAEVGKWVGEKQQRRRGLATRRMIDLPTKAQDLTMPTLEYTLTAQDRKRYREVLGDAFQGRRVEIRAFLDKARLYAHDLPVAVREVALDFANREEHDVLVLRGLPLDMEAIPATPGGISKKTPEFATFNDGIHITTSQLLGDVYTFSSIQHGNIINDVLPIAGHGEKPISSGFDFDFGLHTEDAFSEYSGEFLGLLCFRNPGCIPTIVASMRDARTASECETLLRDNVFGISANVAHDRDLDARTVRRPILFGHRDDPYIRINTNYNAAAGLDDRYASALSELVHALNATAQKVLLYPGDAVYINNRLVAHGRPRYAPTLDGSDRWYRRLYITTDLRKSRHLRSSSTSRVIDMSLA